MKNPTTTPAAEEWGFAVCKECDRAFDLLDEDDASEWYYGHECEES